MRQYYGFSGSARGVRILCVCSAMAEAMARVISMHESAVYGNLGLIRDSCCLRLVGFLKTNCGRRVGALGSRARRGVRVSAQGRDNRDARLALDKDGRFLALEVDTVANLGAYLSTNGPGSSTNSPAQRDGRRLRHPRDLWRCARRLHQHRADRRLSRRRQARSQLPDRAAGRPRGAPLGDRSGRVAPAQHDRAIPVPQRARA